MTRTADSLSTRQQYCLLRRAGYTDAEAAERAGFSGWPGPDARRLLKAVRQEAGANLTRRKRELEDDIARLEFQLERKRRRLEAVEALRAEDSG